MWKLLTILTCVVVVAGLIVAVGVAERPDAEDMSNPVHQFGPQVEVPVMLDDDRLDEVGDDRPDHVRREAEEREAHDRHPRSEPRIHHLMKAARLMHAAAEHLQAGGLPELSERLHHEAERIERECRQRGPQPRLEHAIRELAEQVERLRRDVDRLQDQLKDITEPERD